MVSKHFEVEIFFNVPGITRAASFSSSTRCFPTALYRSIELPGRPISAAVHPDALLPPWAPIVRVPSNSGPLRAKIQGPEQIKQIRQSHTALLAADMSVKTSVKKG